jgi:hypothetical protein
MLYAMLAHPGLTRAESCTHEQSRYSSILLNQTRKLTMHLSYPGSCDNDGSSDQLKAIVAQILLQLSHCKRTFSAFTLSRSPVESALQHSHNNAYISDFSAFHVCQAKGTARIFTSPKIQRGACGLSSLPVF